MDFFKNFSASIEEDKFFEIAFIDTFKLSYDS